MSKSKAEKRLLKNTDRFAELEKELQLVFPPRVFDLIADLAKAYLEVNKHDTPSRDHVSKLAFALRQETFNRFGHESLETIVLAKLLKQSVTGWRQPPPRLDSISHMRTYSKNHRMDAAQEAAAEMIKKVWEAFGRFRFIGARGMDGGGGGASQVLHPLDVMGEDLWEHYCKTYKPWYALAKTVSVNRRRYSEGGLSLAAVSFKVLVEDYFPEEVDKMFALVQGSAYRALRAALTGYYAHEAFDDFLGKSIAAKVTVEDVRSGKPG